MRPGYADLGLSYFGSQCRARKGVGPLPRRRGLKVRAVSHESVPMGRSSQRANPHRVRRLWCIETDPESPTGPVKGPVKYNGQQPR
jgi:hypothetical protein